MRALGLFWIVVLAALGAGAVWLNSLGPPERIPPGLTRAAQAPPLPLAPPMPSPEDGHPPGGAAPEHGPSTPPPHSASPPAQAAPEPRPGPAAAAPEPPPEPTPGAPPLPPDPPGPAASATAVPPTAPPSAPEPPPLPVPAPRAAAVADRPIAPPDPALQEPSPHGPVPRVGPEGRTPIRAYARPFDRTDTRPRIGLVIGNLGLNAAFSDEAIRRLPPAVALAFSPYAARPEALLERARARGMEALTAIPMEPAGYPGTADAGERALLTGAPPGENADRLLWALSRISGQVGAIGALGPMRGERFAALPEAIGAVQDALRNRGLLYLDPRPGAPSPPRAWGRAVDLVVDEPATRGEIERRLAELERIARERGSALGLAADPAPVLVDRIAAWAAGLEERGLVLAPVTALIRRGDEVPRPAP